MRKRADGVEKDARVTCKVNWRSRCVKLINLGMRWRWAERKRCTPSHLIDVFRQLSRDSFFTFFATLLRRIVARHTDWALPAKQSQHFRLLEKVLTGPVKRWRAGSDNSGVGDSRAGCLRNLTVHGNFSPTRQKVNRRSGVDSWRADFPLFALVLQAA